MGEAINETQARPRWLLKLIFPLAISLWHFEQFDCWADAMQKIIAIIKNIDLKFIISMIFYNSNIESTIRIVIHHHLIYQLSMDEFVIRWGSRSSRFFTRLGANFIILYFTTAHYCHYYHSKFMETWIGLMITLLGWSWRAFHLMYIWIEGMFGPFGQKWPAYGVAVNKVPKIIRPGIHMYLR